MISWVILMTRSYNRILNSDCRQQSEVKQKQGEASMPVIESVNLGKLIQKGEI